jgi:hypothetical protein
MQNYNKKAENQNIFDAAAIGKITSTKQDAHAQKVLKIFKDKSYKERFSMAASAAQIVMFMAAIFSSLSAGFLVGYFVYYFLLDFVGITAAITAATAAGVVLSLCLEFGKAEFNGVFWVELYKFASFKKGAFFALFFLSVLSVGSSFYGSTLIPTLKQDSTILDVTKYDNQKDVILAQIVAAQKGSTYRGILTKQGHKQITDLNKQLENVTAASVQYIQRYDTSAANFNTEKENLKKYLGFFSLSLELLFLIANSFYFYFAYRCFLELDIDDNTNLDFVPAELKPFVTPPAAAAPAPAIVATPAPSFCEVTPTAAPVQVRQIGFYPLPIEDKEQTLPLLVNAHGLRVCSCANCGKDFVKNSYQHKFCAETCKLEHHAKKHGGKVFKPKAKAKK